MGQGQRSGLIYALCGFALLSCGDAVVKSMAGQWAPTAIAALRYVIGTLGLGLLLLMKEGPAAFRMPVPLAQFGRGAAVAVASIGFFSAIFVMPLASATALTFTSPMITGLLAAVLLGEPAKKETWIASAIAFAGVLIVLRPNLLAVGAAALFPLLSALGMSLLMIGNRFVAGRASGLAMQFYVALGASPVLIVASVGLHYSGIARFAIGWPEWSIVARCAVVAFSASCAHWLIYLGTTRAGAATIAPMTYVQLLVATITGWTFFHSHPDLWTLAGAMLIIAAGLYLWHAGRVREPAMTD